VRIVASGCATNSRSAQHPPLVVVDCSAQPSGGLAELLLLDCAPPRRHQRSNKVAPPFSSSNGQNFVHRLQIFSELFSERSEEAKRLNFWVSALDTLTFFSEASDYPRSENFPQPHRCFIGTPSSEICFSEVHLLFLAIVELTLLSPPPCTKVRQTQPHSQASTPH
jgi:hypothetical protein